MDTFQVFTWSLKTGRLLEVLAGHEGPVAGLAFNPDLPFLASASWDKTVRQRYNAWRALAPHNWLRWR
jgi:periodic tryptophan protein 2